MTKGRMNLKLKDSENKIRNSSLRFLARRQHSERELKQKLRRKGFSPEEIEEEIEELRRLGLLNDREFALQWAASRRRRLYGSVKIRWELRLKGIDRQLIDEALEKADAVMEEKEAARLLMERKKFRDSSRAYRFLIQRGFSPEIAQELATEVKNEVPRDQG